MADSTKLASVLVVDSLKQGATEIRLEPNEKGLDVRYRIAGVLRTVMTIPLKVARPLTTRIENMAHLDTGEKRRPQIGVIRVEVALENLAAPQWFYVTSVPTECGEVIIMRHPARGPDGEALAPKMGLLPLELSCDRCGREPRGGQDAPCRRCGLFLCGECQPRPERCIKCEGDTG